MDAQRLGPLQNLPVELLCEIFFRLPSLQDVVRFAATCRQIRRVLSTNTTAIVNNVPGVPCDISAQRHLRDQIGDPSNSSIITIADVIRMLRNARVVDSSLEEFERKIVRKVKVYFRANEFYGTPKHPPHLTPTERRRFTMSYYNMWSLMHLDSSQRKCRLEAMTLQHLYWVYEISILRQRVGDEHLPPPIHDEGDEKFQLIRFRRPALRILIEKEIWATIRRCYQQIHNKEAEFVWHSAKEQGYRDHVALFDHFQPELKAAVWNQNLQADDPFLVSHRQLLWDESLI